MLRNIQPEVYQRKARTELEDIKHNLRLLEHITQELDSLSRGVQGSERQLLSDKSERLKVDIRQKLKSMGLNINQIISTLDYKITILTKQISKIQKNTKNSPPTTIQTKANQKAEVQYKYHINQLQERIFQLQKKQNQYVKEISELKEKNAKLRDEFNNLSFDSNQRIKELSEKLHNNTSPNLTIRKPNIGNNLEMSYFINTQQSEKKRTKNNFVKIKGANNFEQDLSPLQVSPQDNKKNKNMLDSFNSESSELDIKVLGYETPEFEQNSGNLKFGCFPGKQVSQKTKTGSTSENKKLKFEQNCQKSRRFEFLLNNLMDNGNDEGDTTSQRAPIGLASNVGYQANQNRRFGEVSQPTGGYQYKAMARNAVQENRNGSNQNMVRRFQI